MQPADASTDNREEASPSSVEEHPARAALLNRVLELAGTSLTAGVFGGLLLFGVEAIDRLSTLWPNFNSMSEALVFVLYLSPTIFLGIAAGAVAGPLLAAVGWPMAPITRLLEGRFGKRAEAVACVVFAAGITAILGLALGLMLRAMGVRSLRRVGLTLAMYFMDANAPLFAQLAQSAAKWFFPLILMGIFVGTVGMVIGSQLVSPGADRFGSTTRRVIAAGGAIGLVGLYIFDSRFEFARYDTIVHIPAAALQCLLAAFLAAVLLNGVRNPATRRTVGRLALAVLAFAVLTGAFVGFHIGSNENLKALLWRRSVVARRAYQATVLLVDRDRDGYSSLLAGGDLNDTDSRVNPMATEIPGNGIDDNCIGGDLAALQVVDAADSVPGPPRGKRFVLIAIDTLRADRMSLYGYGRPTTPRIDEYATSGLVFDRCSSSGTNTAVAFSAMQTSQFRAAVFEPERARLFPTLAKAGYRTGQVNAVIEDNWLRAKHSSVPYRRVILDGIRDFPHDVGEDFWDADKVTDAAIEYLSSLPADAPSATWIHYFDPHTPRRKMAPFDFGNSPSDMYDTEVAFSDREIGRLMDWMQSSGFMDDTIVILMSDHGEAFLEHGMDFHGNRPYAEQVDIPLIVWARGLEPGRTQSPSSVVDIAPTVLDFLGLAPIPGAAGQSLFLPVSADRPIFSETPLNIVDGPFRAFAVEQDGWKLIYDVIGNTTELYNLEQDPHELHNMADSETGRAATMRATLAHWLDTSRSVATATEALDILDNE